jgi:hypothetical protein
MWSLLKDDFETGENPHLGALDDDVRPIYRTWQCQTLKSGVKRALQSTPVGGQSEVL